MFLSVIIPTRGRAASCRATLCSVLRQKIPPDEIIISATEPADWGDAPPDQSVSIVFGAKGLTRQRNRGIAALDRRCRIVTMLDDDVELPEDYFLKVRELFSKHPDIVLSFGSVREMPGANRDQAAQALAEWEGGARFSDGARGLGCSMSIRRDVLDRVKFDERLPLYGWLEDADFAARCRHLGRQGVSEACRTVHLVEPKARLSGVRFGFSQVMNPFYLWQKGTLPLRELLINHWIKGAGSNVVGLIRRDHQIDRWGRLRGQCKALWMIFQGQTEPEYVEQFEDPAPEPAEAGLLNKA